MLHIANLAHPCETSSPRLPRSPRSPRSRLYLLSRTPRTPRIPRSPSLPQTPSFRQPTTYQCHPSSTHESRIPSVLLDQPSPPGRPSRSSSAPLHGARAAIILKPSTRSLQSGRKATIPLRYCPRSTFHRNADGSPHRCCHRRRWQSHLGLASSRHALPPSHRPAAPGPPGR